MTANTNADQHFHAIYTREWEWRQEQVAGADDEDTEARAANHLPRVDAATQAMRERVWASVLQQLDAITPDDLQGDNPVHYAVYHNQIETLLADQRASSWQLPFNSDTAFWSNLGFSARRTLHGTADYQRYLGQLRDIPRYFDEHIANMRTGLARGFSAPRITLHGRDQAIADVATADGESNLFYTPFRQMPSTISTTTKADLRASAIAAINSAVIPAHSRLLAFMRDEYTPAARTSVAAEALPDGVSYYQTQIHKYTTLDMDADTIHALGVQEVQRIHEQMAQTMRDAGFSGSFSEFQGYLRSSPQFYATSADALLKEAAWIANQINGKLDQYIGHLPRRRFVISAVPDELAPFYTSGRGGPGYYLVNTHDLRSRPLYALTALTLHEAVPGHALQMPLAAEQANLPDFRRYCHLSAYDEGWALYAERLGVEMGLYETPFDHFGYLAYQAWRACRLVVDTGLHHLGWSRPQACNYLREHTALSEHEIRTEVDRYIAWPGHALSYYLGEMCIVQARAKAEQALGPRFDLRAFHDAVLALGSVPLPVLEQHIDRFVANGGHSPWADATSH